MMKTYLTVLFWCLYSASVSFAADSHTHNVEPQWTQPDIVEPQKPLEDDFAKVQVTVIHHHEWKELSITMTCKDRRLKPDAKKPQPEMIFNDEACFVFEGHLNKTTHRLSLRYVKLRRHKDGIALCDDGWEKNNQLDLMCGDWQ